MGNPKKLILSINSGFLVSVNVSQARRLIAFES